MTILTTETRPAIDDELDSLPERPYRMSYDTYLRIAESGAIRPEDHVVLFDGILVQSMIKGSRHIITVERGTETLKAAAPANWFVRSEAAVVLRDGRAETSVPEPDIVVVRGNRDAYEDRLPEAHELGLVVEVASSPTAFATDRRGLHRYAHAGIPTVWIVAIHDRSIHVRTEPSGPTTSPGYARVAVKRSGELLEALLASPLANQPPAILGPITVASFFRPEQ